MSVRIHTPGIYLWLIRLFSLLAPTQSRLEWRREWEAEIVSRWLLLEEWERLNTRSKLDLLKRVQGAFSDVLSLQPSPTSVVLFFLNLLIALLTGFGAVQQFIFDGISDRHLQPAAPSPPRHHLRCSTR